LTAEIVARRQEVQHLLLGISMGLLRSRVLHAAAELGVADALAAGPMPVRELASRLGADPDALYRLLRTLSAMGIFVELDGPSFSLNDAAEYLRSDAPHSLRDLVRYLGAEWNVDTLKRTAYSVRTGVPAFDAVHGISLFDYLAQNEEDGRLFDSALERFARSAAEAVVAAYDFTRFASVVDVGGGKGRLLGALLRKCPGVRGVLLDRPDVIDAVASSLTGSDVGDRVECVGGDFFQSVPKGHDAYILKHVIHDWDPAHALRILEICRAAMPEKGRLLLVESVLDGQNRGEFAKLMDVGMLTTTGGRERTEAEYAELFRQAGLDLLQVIPTRSSYCVLEAVSARPRDVAP
jgi:hypothetical protein